LLKKWVYYSCAAQTKSPRGSALPCATIWYPADFHLLKFSKAGALQLTPQISNTQAFGRHLNFRRFALKPDFLSLNARAGRSRRLSGSLPKASFWPPKRLCRFGKTEKF